VLAICAFVIVIALLAVATAKVLFVLFAGVLLALSLRAISVAFARLTRLPIGFSVGLFATLLVGCGGLFTVLFLPKAIAQIELLRSQLPGVLDSVRGHWFGHLVLESSQLSPGKQPVSPEPGLAVKAAASAVNGSIQALGALVVVFFVGLYGAAQPRDYVSACLALTPKPQREHVRAVLDAVQQALTRWLLARIVAMLFVAVTTTIAFVILKLPLAVTLGLLAGALAFIEYAGAIASAIPPLAFALSQGTDTALWVLGVYTGLHIIEGYVLTPLLSRFAVRLPPAFTLASQVLLGVLLGPVGLTFSTPLLVAIVSAVRAWRETEATLGPARSLVVAER
jgi:predicted PurR-regulated permease PerM